MSGKEKDRGQVSTVLKSFPDTNKVIVKDINVVTRHLKRQGTNP
jgi:large subunit ribosomal protein L24